MIPYKATQAAIPSCGSAANLLENSDFEKGTGWDAASWQENSDATNGGGDNGYHCRITKSEAHSGSNVLESYATGAGTYITRSNSIEVPNYGTYIISGWVYNNLNGGQPYISIENKNGLESAMQACTGLPANGSRVWSQFFCKFSLTQSQWQGNFKNIKVRLITKGLNLNGTLWFDDIKLQENCLAQPITLYHGHDSSNYKQPNPDNDIYFDGQAETCSFQADGCSELIRNESRFGH